MTGVWSNICEYRWPRNSHTPISIIPWRRYVSRRILKLLWSRLLSILSRGSNFIWAGSRGSCSRYEWAVSIRIHSNNFVFHLNSFIPQKRTSFRHVDYLNNLFVSTIQKTWANVFFLSQQFRFISDRWIEIWFGLKRYRKKQHRINYLQYR